jgi:Rod binding domain-containing protein
MSSVAIKPPVAIDASAAIERNRLMAPPAAGGEDHHEQLIKQTEKWVAQTFYGELLKQMRESPFRSDMFEGGKGGKTFETMLDQRMADQMSRHAGGKLVRTIVKKIEAGEAARRYRSASKGTAPAKLSSPPGRSARQLRDPAPPPVAHNPRQLHAGQTGPKAYLPRQLGAEHEPPKAHIPSYQPRVAHQLHAAGQGTPQRHAGMLRKAPSHVAGKHF